MEAVGVFGTSAITAVTAQNTTGVSGTHVVPTNEITAQIRAVLDDFAVEAAKTGMLATAPIIETVREELSTADFPVVVDPVMVAASGDRLLDQDAEQAYESLIADATIVTPNADEAAVLTGIDIESESEQIEAGDILLDMGVEAALVKGGHVGNDPVRDVLVQESTVRTYEHPRVDTRATHGSGCTLASAIASNLALGADVPGAVERGLALMERAVRYPIAAGSGPGSVHHLATLRNQAEKPATVEALRTTIDNIAESMSAEWSPTHQVTVAGATPFAEDSSDIMIVEPSSSATGREQGSTQSVSIRRSGRLSNVILGLREHDPTIRFAFQYPYEPAIENAMGELDWHTVRHDGSGADADTDSDMRWRIEELVADLDSTPVAIVDTGDHGARPMAYVVSESPQTLVSRVSSLLDAVDSSPD